MYNSVIAGYSRSPFAMANKGKLIDVKPVNLLAEVIKNLVSQSKINLKELQVHLRYTNAQQFHYPSYQIR